MEKGEGVSFGLPSALCHLGSKLSRLYRHVGIFHCTCATFRIRRNLDSTLVFASCWGFLHRLIWLIRLCNMRRYTYSMPTLLVGAGRGCFGLATCAEAGVSLLCPMLLARAERRERTYPMNMRGKAHVPAANTRIAISNIPSSFFGFALKTTWLGGDIKGFENCS